MKKLTLILLVLILSAASCSYLMKARFVAAGVYGIHFRFKKGILPNTYNLKIDNQSDTRAVEFAGCYSAASAETNFYVLFKNGTKQYFDSKVFCGIGAKGRYWVNPRRKGSIPFKIEQRYMTNAEKIVLKGEVYIQRMEGFFMNKDELRELTLTYDVETRWLTPELGEKIEHPHEDSSVLDGILLRDNLKEPEEEFEYKRLSIDEQITP